MGDQPGVNSNVDLDLVPPSVDEGCGSPPRTGGRFRDRLQDTHWRELLSSAISEVCPEKAVPASLAAVLCVAPK